jgi:hypothetical protein
MGKGSTEEVALIGPAKLVDLCEEDGHSGGGSLMNRSMEIRSQWDKS